MLDQEVVLELLAVIVAADVDLDVGEETLHGVGHDVLGRVPDHLAGLGIPDGDDLDRRVAPDRGAQVHQLAVDASGQGRLGEPRPDALRDREHSGSGGKLEDLPVGQAYVDVTHEWESGMKVVSSDRREGDPLPMRVWGRRGSSNPVPMQPIPSVASGRRWGEPMVGTGGIEPPTSAVSRRRSSP